MLYKMAQSSGYQNLTKENISNYYSLKAFDYHYPNAAIQRHPLLDTQILDRPQPND